MRANLPGHALTARRTMVRVVAAAALTVPLLPVALWAVADRWTFPAHLPQQWGLRGFAEAANSDALPAALRSALVGTLVAVAATTLGAMAGRALGWRLVRHRALVIGALMSPMALPPLAVAMGLDTVVLRSGVPELVGVVVILTVFAMPYTVFIIGARYAALDPAVEEQARLLGATPAKTLAFVTIPALAPALATAAFMAFLVGWTDYAVTVLVGGGQLVTLPLLVAGAASGTGNEPAVAVLSTLSLLPPLLALTAARALTSKPDRAGHRHANAEEELADART